MYAVEEILVIYIRLYIIHLRLGQGAGFIYQPPLPQIEAFQLKLKPN
jgi:hypothetical protein